MVTRDEWDHEATKTRQRNMLSPAIAALYLVGVLIPSMMAGHALASGFAGYLVSAAVLLAAVLPMSLVLAVVLSRQATREEGIMRQLNDELSEAAAAAEREATIRETQVQRQRFESRLANALDMAEGEPEVIDVIERSFGAVLADSAAELLLADNSHAHLTRMAAVGPAGEPPGCGVDSPDQCPAARRAQIQAFPDSDALDACPKLRNRAQGRLSALCVPVSIMGRTVGVIHATGQPEVDVESARVDDLATLAKLAGARIGLLRVMAETQLQASTDTLTGLLNRRSFSEKVAALPAQTALSVAMADLDHFKKLNDTFGHETGDRALRLFSRVLRDSLRGSDLVARYGGEEFAIAFPDCSITDATRALNALRAQLDAAVTVGGLPGFTVSFGVTSAEPHEDMVDVLRRADGALLAAKREGRDRVVAWDTSGVVVPVDEEDRARRLDPVLDLQALPAEPR